MRSIIGYTWKRSEHPHRFTLSLEGDNMAHVQPSPPSLLKGLPLLSLYDVNYLHFKIFYSEGELY